MYESGTGKINTFGKSDAEMFAIFPMFAIPPTCEYLSMVDITVRRVK